MSKQFSYYNILLSINLSKANKIKIMKICKKLFFECVRVILKKYQF